MRYKMNYQWYPGHMTKAKRMMEENIKLIDLVIEIVDARIPISSRNPDIDSLAVNKARIILLNKSDLADDKITNQWINYFNENNIYCLKLNSRNNSGIKQVNGLIMTACADKIERNKQRGSARYLRGTSIVQPTRPPYGNPRRAKIYGGLREKVTSLPIRNDR